MPTAKAPCWPKLERSIKTEISFRRCQRTYRSWATAERRCRADMRSLHRFPLDRRRMELTLLHRSLSGFRVRPLASMDFCRAEIIRALPTTARKDPRNFPAGSRSRCGRCRTPYSKNREPPAVSIGRCNWCGRSSCAASRTIRIAHSASADRDGQSGNRYPDDQINDVVHLEKQDGSDEQYIVKGERHYHSFPAAEKPHDDQRLDDVHAGKGDEVVHRDMAKWLVMVDGQRMRHESLLDPI